MFTGIASSVIGLLTGFVNALRSLFDWKRERELRAQGRLEQQVEDLKATKKAVEDANEARIETAKRINDVPPTDSLPDDGFRRD